MSTTRRTAGVFSRKRPLGPNGERLCFNCNGPLPKGKPFNCSTKCSEEWRQRTSPAAMRWAVHKRDKGICAECGTDTDKLKLEYNAMPKADCLADAESKRRIFLERHGIPFARSSGDFWDADHIVPVVEGGGECGIQNIRTLCIPCHAKETAKLRERMRERRHEAKILAKDQARGLLADLL